MSELTGFTSTSVVSLDLPAACRNALLHGGIDTVGKLVMKSDDELVRIPNIGKASIRKIRGLLSRIGAPGAEDYWFAFHGVAELAHDIRAMARAVEVMEANLTAYIESTPPICPEPGLRAMEVALGGMGIEALVVKSAVARLRKSMRRSRRSLAAIRRFVRS
jgi:hypothetical protein